MASPRKINVISVEFNDCLYSQGYKFYNKKKSLDIENPFFLTNNRFISRLAENITDGNFAQAHLLIGSSRQDPYTDRDQSYLDETPSCVYSFGTLTEALTKSVYNNQSKCRVIPDEFLLGDVYFQQQDYSTFDAIQKSYDREGKFTPAFTQQVDTRNKALFDSSYVSLLYAQIHKLASQHPNDDIEFDYYHADGQTLNDLHNFFTQHSSLIPDNVRLKLHQYKGEFEDKFKPGSQTELVERKDELLIQSTFEDILGNGAIDYNYRRNTIRLAESAGVNVEQARNNQVACDLAQLYANNANALAAFNKSRKLVGQVLTKDGLQQTIIDRDHIDGDFNPHLLIQNLHEEIDELRHIMGNQADLQQNTELLTALKNLCNELAGDLTAQAKKGVSPVMMRQSHAMQVAKNTARLVNDLQNDELPQESRLDLIDAYLKKNQKKSGFCKNFLKAIAVVAIAAVGFVVGAVVGAGIGIAAGAWSGPGAAVTGLAGLFTGAATGAAIGVAAGAAVTGIAAGSISGYLLFRKDKISKGVEAVGSKSRLFQPPVRDADDDVNMVNSNERQPLLSLE